MSTATSLHPQSAITPWVEKYRPKSLTDVSHQSEVVSTLQNAVETDRLPHLLLYGPPGTGKTSVALALCRTLWDPESLKRRVLELNASDERGISVVRDKIKHFASLAVGDQPKAGAAGDRRQRDGTAAAGGDPKSYPNPPFKIIILDEADTVTPDAQAALRRIIEATSKITRFILICNYVTRIIDPLASRCAKFRFQALPPESMKARLTHIAHSEGCRFPEGEEEDVLDEILNLSGGDMRRAVTSLQSAHSLSGAVVGADGGGGRAKGVIRKDALAEMAGLPPSNLVDGLVASLKSGKFDAMEAAVMNVIAEGFAAQHVLQDLSKRCISMDGLDEMSKADLSIRIAEADKKLVDGADEVLQLLAVGSLGLRCFANSSAA